jgi:hypothetical protein
LSITSIVDLAAVLGGEVKLRQHAGLAGFRQLLGQRSSVLGH